MPSSIPYDHPSLVLGNIVDTRVLDVLKKISSLQDKIDAAQHKMNSLVLMKRSLSMTMNELIDMNVEISDIEKKIKELDTSITQAATDYMTVRITNEANIQQLREKVTELDLGDPMETPVDFELSNIKYLKLSSESLKLDAQYFSYASNQQDDMMANIEKYIKESNHNLGSKAGDLSKAVTVQINQQRQNHNIAGTLIITASCTHPTIAMIEPFVIDVDKAIAIWNTIHSEDTIQTDDSIIRKHLSQTDTKNNENHLTVISGATYGSSFVGMVHILKSNITSFGLTDSDVASLQRKLAIGGWLQNASGGFGVDPSTMEEVKKMLSTQNISSHIGVIVMGAIPAIGAGNLKSSVQTLLNPDPEKLKGYLSMLTEPSDNTTVESEANEAKTDNRLINLQNATTKNIVRELGKIDHESNNVFDINSMMNAFDNYLKAIANKGGQTVGMPVNFYLKKITKNQLIKWYASKYYSKKNKGEENIKKNEKEDNTTDNNKKDE